MAVLSLAQPVIMGILNITPDSFSDAGEIPDVSTALRRAGELVQAGARIIDVGGESTRPGAVPVAAETELRRVLPIIEALASRCAPAVISVDTSKACVADAALGAGARIVNDVSAMRDTDMPAVVRRHQATIVLMHMRGEPKTMQRSPVYDDVVAAVCQDLRRARDGAIGYGIAREHIWLDPGIGFGKTPAHNLQLIKRLDTLAQMGQPIVLGPSRKAFLGHITGHAAPADRDAATAAMCVAGALYGAQIFRVHSAAAVRDALLVAHALLAIP